MSTTHINEPTEPNAKSKEGQLLETISLRDYFAAKAMQGSLAAADGDIHDSSMFANWCYALADAMMKAR